LTDDFDDEIARIRAVGRNIQKLLGEPEPNKTPKDLTLFGLTLDEADDWIQSEPDFNRRIVTPLDNRRRSNRAGIWNTFKLAQFEPEDANLPPYRLYPLTRLANGGELALATEP
jgi:hypothetical protein